jgi:dCTP deaminase
MKKGALPSQELRRLIEAGVLQNVQAKNISIASLDLSISEECYRVDGVFLPKTGETIQELIQRTNGTKHSLSEPLERGVVYVIKMNESVHLPNDLYGYCNPKSSTGRHDLHVRILIDGIARYDTVPNGTRGDIWALAVARSYPVLLSQNFAVSQLRLFTHDTRFTEQDLEKEWNSSPFVLHLDGKPYSYESFKMHDADGSILLTLDLSQDIVGYECRGANTVLNLQTPNNSNDPKPYFTPLYKEGQSIILKKDSFYILSTKEALKIPPHIASEMVDMDSRTGEFRTHYAGFFDPGWGYGAQGVGKGRPITLEVRPFEDVIISHGQPIGKVRFEYMAELPEKHYDEANSNYLTQSGPKLAKQFKPYDATS